MPDAARALLARLRARGFTLRAEGGQLIVTPGSRLTAQEAGQVRACRDALLELVGDDGPQFQPGRDFHFEVTGRKPR